MHDRTRLFRLPLMAAALLGLVLGGWAGLARIGWRIPAADLIALHGPLMIAGFFGTLISIERAVALQKPWVYIGAALCAAGTVALLAGQPKLAALLITLSSVAFWLMSSVLALQYRAPFSALLALGGLLWAIGNGLWLAGWPVYRVVHWWVAFLIVTIAGERLELARLARITRWSTLLLGSVIAGLAAGLTFTLFDLAPGVRIIGGAYVALACWLITYDIARRTIRTRGLPRYVAFCLLGGFGWLIVGGGLALYAGGAAAGMLYDAMLHAVLIGFIMLMVFGHAPIILPALLKQPVSYTPAFHLPPVLLHLSLLLRISADGILWPGGRQWGGLLNGVAILLFIGIMAVTAADSRRGSSRPDSQQDRG